MKTISPVISSFDEAIAKARELFTVMLEFLQRLPPTEASVLRMDLIEAAEKIDSAKNEEELGLTLLRSIHAMGIHIRSVKSLSSAGQRFGIWLQNVEKQLHKFTHSHNPFIQKWPRLWKAQVVSLLGLVDMAIWIGEAVARRIKGEVDSAEKKYLLRCWKNVEAGIGAHTPKKLSSLLRRARQDRERVFLTTKERLSSSFSDDVGALERATGVEEYLLKEMVEMAAKKVQEGERVDTGISEFAALHEAMNEHITVIGTEAAESSAVTLVRDSIAAEQLYLALCKRWGIKDQHPLSDSVQRAERYKEFHEAHCRIIDSYMELSDSKSLRGVMLCYELPIFTQLLYDQRKRLDREMKAVDQEERPPESLVCLI